MTTALDLEHQDNEAEDHFDKLREECGVMAVYNHPDAARLTYWGLYSLQHRGQESGGIASADGEHVHDIKGMGLVSEIFTDDVLAKLPGHPRHWSYPLQHHRRLRPAQRSAHLSRVHQGPHRHCA